VFIDFLRRNLLHGISYVLPECFFTTHLQRTSFHYEGNRSSWTGAVAPMCIMLKLFWVYSLTHHKLGYYYEIGHSCFLPHSFKLFRFIPPYLILTVTNLHRLYINTLQARSSREKLTCFLQMLSFLQRCIINTTNYSVLCILQYGVYPFPLLMHFSYMRRMYW
jgi:hypothetical protein